MKNSEPKSPGTASRFYSRGIFPYQLAFTLLIPLRNIFLSPKRLVKRLDISDSMRVMEVGPGPGYFSARTARTLSNGSLVLADIQPEMLEIARKRLNRKGITNIEYSQCDGNTFNFPDNSFDRIYMVTVIGEVEHKAAYFSEFRRLLTADGILSISEQPGDPDRMTAEELTDLAHESGFVTSQFFGSPRNYTINFKKPNFRDSRPD